MVLQCFACIELIEGSLGSNLTANTGFCIDLFLITLLKAALLGMALALSIDESISFSGYSLESNIFLSSLCLISLSLLFVQTLTILKANENGIFLRLFLDGYLKAVNTGSYQNPFYRGPFQSFPHLFCIMCLKTKFHFLV